MLLSSTDRCFFHLLMASLRYLTHRTCRLRRINLVTFTHSPEARPCPLLLLSLALVKRPYLRRTRMDRQLQELLPRLLLMQLVLWRHPRLSAPIPSFSSANGCRIARDETCCLLTRAIKPTRSLTLTKKQARLVNSKRTLLSDELKSSK